MSKSIQDSCDICQEVLDRNNLIPFDINSRRLLICHNCYKNIFEDFKRKIKEEQTIKLVINIPKETYEDIKNDEWIDTEPIHNMVKAIKNGMPLDDFLKHRKEPINQNIVDKYIAQLKNIEEK